MEDESLVERLKAYFNHYDPQKIDTIPDLLKRYKGKEAEIFKKLLRQYGPEIIEQGQAQQNTFSSVNSSAKKPIPKVISQATTSEEIESSPGRTRPVGKSSRSRNNKLMKRTRDAIFGQSLENEEEEPTLDEEMEQSEERQENFKTTFAEVLRSNMKSQYFHSDSNLKEDDTFCCGKLYRNWMMIRKWKLQFYVLDVSKKLFLEFENEKDDKPRNILSLRNARMTDEIEIYTYPRGELYCWDIFFRNPQSGKPPRIFKLGAISKEQSQQWQHEMKRLIQSSDPMKNGDNSSEKISPTKTSIEMDSAIDQEYSHDEDVNSSCDSQEREADEIRNVAVYIDGIRHVIPCNANSSNAWLLSEAIRISGSKDDWIGLRTSLGRTLRLADDVFDSIDNSEMIFAFKSEDSSKGNVKKIQRWYRKNRGQQLSIDNEIDDLLPTEDEKESFESDSTPNIQKVLHETSDQVQTLLPQAFLVNTQLATKLLRESINTLEYALDKYVPSWPSSSWESAKVKSNVRIFKKQNYSGLLGFTSAPCHASLVFEHLLNVHKQPQWNPILKHVRLLECAGSSDVVVARTESMHLGSALLFPRQFCYCRMWQKHSNGCYVIAMAQVNHPLCPKAVGYTSASNNGAIAITPFADGTGCVVIYLCNADVKSYSYLTWINQRFQEKMVETLAGLLDAVISA